MRTTLVADESMDFIDNYRFDMPQPLATFDPRQQQVQRFGCGDEDVRRPSSQCRAVLGGGVAGSQADANRGNFEPFLLSQREDLVEWTLQIPLHVVRQGPQGGDIDHAQLIVQFPGNTQFQQPVNGGQKGRQRLPRSGGRSN